MGAPLRPYLPGSGANLMSRDARLRRRVQTGASCPAVSGHGYGGSDADLIARWTTIYNAVVRGNMDFFSDRYKTIVTGYLSAETAGLSRRYDEWPGMSRVVIPLSSTATPGVLGTVDPGELGDDRVIEELRLQEERGIDERQDMVDLTERVIDEREDAIAREEEAIAREEARIAAEEARAAEERRAIEEDREAIASLAEDEREAAEDGVAEREAELAERERRAQEAREAVEERRDEVVDDRQAVADLTDRVRAERERIASDARALLDEREISEEVRGLQGELTPVYFLRVRDQAGVILGQLVQINPVTGLLLNRSTEDRIVSRSYTFYNEQLLVIVASGETGRLAEFDVTSLREVSRSEREVFLGSSMAVHGTPARAYAVVRDAGAWYLGRFDETLALIDRSVIAVNPHTTLAFSENRVWIQTADDRIVSLGLADLRIVP